MLTSDIYDQRPAIDAGRSLVAQHRLALAALAEEPIRFRATDDFNASVAASLPRFDEPGLRKSAPSVEAGGSPRRVGELIHAALEVS
jgi:hypothetical protein